MWIRARPRVLKCTCTATHIYVGLPAMMKVADWISEAAHSYRQLSALYVYTINSSEYLCVLEIVGVT